MHMSIAVRQHHRLNHSWSPFIRWTSRSVSSTTLSQLTNRVAEYTANLVGRLFIASCLASKELRRRRLGSAHLFPLIVPIPQGTAQPAATENNSKKQQSWYAFFSHSIIEQLHQLIDIAGCLIHRPLYDSFGVIGEAPSFDGTCDHLVRQLFS